MILCHVNTQHWTKLTHNIARREHAKLQTSSSKTLSVVINNKLSKIIHVVLIKNCFLLNLSIRAIAITVYRHIYHPLTNLLLHYTRIYHPLTNLLLHYTHIYHPLANLLLHYKHIYHPLTNLLLHYTHIYHPLTNLLLHYTHYTTH